MTSVHIIFGILLFIAFDLGFIFGLIWAKRPRDISQENGI